MNRKRMCNLMLAITVAGGLMVSAWGVSAAERHDMDEMTTGASAQSALTVTSDADTVSALGLLQGDGNGVNADYLAKTSTRLQAAIISLRLQGHLQEALSYQAGNNANFTDASLVNTTNQTILAYLKNHPERGWTGMTDGSFDPLSEITSQQLYKVLLEVLGFKSEIDFQYADTESFAASKGLMQIAGTNTLSNAHIATALVESLSAKTSAGEPLFSRLQGQKAIPSDARLPEGKRITLRTDAKLGTYFADHDGRTLYIFTRDAANLESCQGTCIENWPIYYAEKLQIPAQLEARDFSVYTRANGTKQLTYKGWPLYYYVKDQAAGNVLGEGVGGVWFLAKSDLSLLPGAPTQPAGQTSTGSGQAETKTYTIDIKNFSYSTKSLEVEAGSKITFTNFDDMKHNAVAADGTFQTPLLAKGESFTITLDKPGTYDYFCTPHKEFMTGQIIVK